MKQLTAIKQLNSIFLPPHSKDYTYSNIILTASAELLRLGYVLSKTAFSLLSDMPENMCKDILKDVIVSCRIIKGDDVSYSPMYPNFPAQVMEASDSILLLNAIMHYWNAGTWLPSYTKLPRDFTFDAETLTVLSPCSDVDAFKLFNLLVSSKDSLSEDHRNVVIELLSEYGSELDYPNEIPFKETSCMIVAWCIANKRFVNMTLIGTATDVLRVATALSDGDVSLAENTRFKSFPRKIRRLLVEMLEFVISEEDIKRHSKKWVRLFHSLHIGEYGGDSAAIAKKVREGVRLESFNARVEALMGGDSITLVEHLAKRPGEYVRRIDEMLRKGHSPSLVIPTFENIAHAVPTRILAQFYGALKNRVEDSSDYIVFPKGNTQHAKIVSSDRQALDLRAVRSMHTIIANSLESRFSLLPSLGKVYVDERLKDCPIPSAMRSNTGVVARGTQLPMGDKSTLRFFVYWVGDDIDLSATFYNDAFENVGQVSYTNLRNNGLGTYHSGDIVSAPNGACEFIDINVPRAAETARYVAMDLLVFSGPNFSEHEKCYAGWMARDSIDDGEIFEPKTVVQKFDVTGSSRNCIPVLFDLKEGKAIWVDLCHYSTSIYNNVEGNSASIKECLKSICTMAKFTLYDLYVLHATARGELTTDITVADTVFDMDRVFDIAEINAEYMV